MEKGKELNSIVRGKIVKELASCSSAVQGLVHFLDESAEMRQISETLIGHISETIVHLLSLSES